MVEKYEFDTNGLVMSPSPHLFSKRTSAWIMQQVIIALIFPAIAATYFFGLQVLMMLFVGIFSSVLFEYLYQKISRKKNYDLRL